MLSDMEYRDIHNFKRCYKYLVEEKGRTQKSICEETGLQPGIITKIIRSKNGDTVKLNSSTLAKIQDFNTKYREEAEAFKKQTMSPQELKEFAEELEEEGYLGRKKPPTIAEEKDAALKSLDQCDTFDLLRQLSYYHCVQVTININLKKFKKP
jgi:transcriptional regulator with XRE-family HTH domain